MTIIEKIQKATEYVAKLEGIQEGTTLRNDAANLWAESFEEYCAIWDALREGPCEIELNDSCPGYIIEPQTVPEVVIPEDFSI